MIKKAVKLTNSIYYTGSGEKIIDSNRLLGAVVVTRISVCLAVPQTASVLCVTHRAKRNVKRRWGPRGRNQAKLCWLTVHGRRSGKDGYHVVASDLTRGGSQPIKRSQGTSNGLVFARI